MRGVRQPILGRRTLTGEQGTHDDVEMSGTGQRRTATSWTRQRNKSCYGWVSSARFSASDDNIVTRIDACLSPVFCLLVFQVDTLSARIDSAMLVAGGRLPPAERLPRPERLPPAGGVLAAPTRDTRRRVPVRGGGAEGVRKKEPLVDVCSASCLSLLRVLYAEKV